MDVSSANELLALNQRLINAIAEGDWATYQELCDPSLTAFEPEGRGQLIVGLDFHHYYFQLGGIPGRHQTTMAAPNVRIVGDIAILSYVRLIQRVNNGDPTTSVYEETRVWQKRSGAWKHIHFHRSKPA